VRLAVLARRQDPFSLRIYRENVARELTNLGVEVVSFTEEEYIPEGCDIAWEPGLAGNRVPHPIFKTLRIPLVATVHGAVPFTIKWYECFPDPLRALRGKLGNYRDLAEWWWFRKKVSAVIAVSEFGAGEVSSVFGLPQGMIHPVYHGVDHETFCAEGDPVMAENPYLLHVSQYQPKKNVDRVFEAYAQLPETTRPNLTAVLPKHQGKTPSLKGVEVIKESLSPAELAEWYRGALGFVVPSLHESFGMPILEAMACGCPVITSNITACPEVAGDAALLVNPRRIEEIATAMQRLTEDESHRETLRQKGLARAREFTWRKSAEGHLKIFQRILDEA
jgi:glycosyltransferase involved in cell wall biosynthesis